MTETTAANPELLADQVAQLLVQPLEAASVVLASGPRVFDTAGVLRIPKLVSGATVGFVGEGGQIPDDADVDFDELVLMPTERKSIKTILRFTKELVRQSVIGIDAVLQARLVKDVSDVLDDALLKGDGASDSITGIINKDGVTTGDFDPTDPDTLLDAIGLLNAQEVVPNRWFINGSDFVTLRKEKETTDSAKYVLEPDLTADATYRLFGIPVVIHQQTGTGHGDSGRHGECGRRPRRRALGDGADRAVRRVRRGWPAGSDPIRLGSAAPRRRWRCSVVAAANHGGGSRSLRIPRPTPMTRR